MAVTHELRNRIRILDLLYECGAKNEKDLLTLKIDQVIKHRGIRLEDLKSIVEMREVVSKKGLFAYLFSEKKPLNNGGLTERQPGKESIQPAESWTEEDVLETAGEDPKDDIPEDPIVWN